jgi:hypothetical protein
LQPADDPWRRTDEVTAPIEDHDDEPTAEPEPAPDVEPEPQPEPRPPESKSKAVPESKVPEQKPFPLADAGKYYDGMWSGIPNYKCPYCHYAVLGRTPERGDGAIELHILTRIDTGDPRHLKALELE